MAEFRKCFHAIDVNDTGCITVEDLRNYMKKMNYTEKFLANWIKLFRVSEDGVITYEHFCKTLGILPRRHETPPPTSLPSEKNQEVIRESKKITSQKPELTNTKEVIRETEITPEAVGGKPETKDDQVEYITQGKTKSERRKKKQKKVDTDESTDISVNLPETVPSEEVIMPVASKETLAAPNVANPLELDSSSNEKLPADSVVQLNAHSPVREHSLTPVPPDALRNDHWAKIEEAPIRSTETDRYSPLYLHVTEPIGSILSTTQHTENQGENMRCNVGQRDFEVSRSTVANGQMVYASLKQSDLMEIESEPVKNCDMDDPLLKTISDKAEVTSVPGRKPGEHLAVEHENSFHVLSKDNIVNNSNVQVSNETRTASTRQERSQPKVQQVSPSRSSDKSNSSIPIENAENSERKMANKIVQDQNVPKHLTKENSKKIENGKPNRKQQKSETLGVSLKLSSDQPVELADLLVSKKSDSIAKLPKSSSKGKDTSKGKTAEVVKQHDEVATCDQVKTTVKRKREENTREELTTTKSAMKKSKSEVPASIPDPHASLAKMEVFHPDLDKLNSKNETYDKSSLRNELKKIKAAVKSGRQLKSLKVMKSKKRKERAEKDVEKKSRFPRSFIVQPDPLRAEVERHKLERRQRRLVEHRCPDECDRKKKRKTRLTALTRWNVRPSLRSRGSVLILLAGPHRGKRVIYLGRQRSTGLLLVTGPFKYNGCPLRRVHPNMVIVTKTKINLKKFSLPTRVHEKAYFARAARTKSNPDETFLQESPENRLERYKPNVQRKEDQLLIDRTVCERIKAHPDAKILIKYLRSLFSLTKNDRPHKMVF